MRGRLQRCKDGRMKNKTKKQNSAKAGTASKKVLILRTCNADMTSHGGFVWPERGPVKAPDWNDKAECGNGLHGWLWGCGDWSLAIGGTEKKWIIFEADAKDVIQLNGKVKVPTGDVLFVSNKWNESMAFLCGRASLPCESSATGDYGHASATGYCGHASATGYYGHASATGDYGHASATGYCGHASATGYYGHASATGGSGHASATGYYGHASATGDYGHASATGGSGHASATGGSGWAISNLGTARAGVDGILTIRYKNTAGKIRVATAYVGENGIKANVFYSVNSDGTFAEATK